jgi:lactate dehydrogenase-like 2-hydroxyacid dehydrogenase
VDLRDRRQLQLFGFTGEEFRRGREGARLSDLKEESGPFQDFVLFFERVEGCTASGYGYGEWGNGEWRRARARATRVVAVQEREQEQEQEQSSGHQCHEIVTNERCMQSNKAAVES